MLIGYARVGTSGQLLDRQQHALTGAGCFRVFAGQLSARTPTGPSWRRAWTSCGPVKAWWCRAQGDLVGH